MTRRTSSAVTIPSPDVVCSRMITWPLFSPPRTAPDTCIPSRMYLSPTGVRTTWPPAASTTAWRPPFERTETTSPPPGSVVAAQPIEGQDPEDLVAVDDRPGGVDGDQPVGVAVEREAGVGAGRDDRLGERGRRGRTRPDVDVDAVGIGVDDLDPGAGRGQDLAADHGARAVRRVEHEVQAAAHRSSRRAPSRWAR